MVIIPKALALVNRPTPTTMATDPQTTQSGLGFDRYTLNPVDLAETPDKHAGTRRVVTAALGIVIVGALGFIFWNSFFRDRAPSGPAAQQFLASLSSENPETAKYVEKAEFQSAIRLRLWFDREVWDDERGGYRSLTDREVRDTLLHAMQAYKDFMPNRQLKILAFQGIAKLGEADYFPGSGLINILTAEAEAQAQEMGSEGPTPGTPQQPGSDGH